MAGLKAEGRGNERRLGKGEPILRVPPATERLLRQIGHLGACQGVPVYAVGGCVRDWCLGLRGMADLDVTVEGSGIALAQAVARELGGRATIHAQFGTATVTLSKKTFVPSFGRAEGIPQRVDFASCRREAYGRAAAYPRVEQGTLEDDLFRRDFTINAMAMAVAPDRFGALVDFFNGQFDLRQRQLRVLHPRSFFDDPSRILRGVRFLRRFGLEWESQTKRLLREAVAAGAIGWLNPGRLERELKRFCEEPDPLACLKDLALILKAAEGPVAAASYRRPS